MSRTLFYPVSMFAVNQECTLNQLLYYNQYMITQALITCTLLPYTRYKVHLNKFNIRCHLDLSGSDI